MYEAFFGMQQRPFAATPSVDGYFPAQAIEQARQTIQRGIQRAAGPAVVIGPAGSGKTLLLARLGAEFAEQFDVAMLSSGRLRSVRALLQNILFELKLPFRDLSEGELRLALLDHLEPNDQEHNGLLLFIDEAQAMPAQLLDELRMITNLVRGGQPRVRLVLAGDVRLEDRLANPRLASFQQRIAARCYLQAWSSAETRDYIRHQLAWAKATPQRIFADEAAREVHDVTGGVPRLINQLCDHALLLASIAGEKQLTAQRITEAWADLQQLPLPTPARDVASDARGQAAVVEFGSLEDIEDAGVADAEHQHAALESLEVLEERVAAVVRAEECEFDPLSTVEPEAGFVCETPFHPFGDAYAEEEVVIDRYASLEAKTMHCRPHVTSSEGREIAAMMGASSRRKLGIVSVESAAEILPGDVATEAFDDPFDPASDPVLPDYPPQYTENVAARQPELVVVDNQGSFQRSAPACQPTGKAQRQEYRQLFARLRRGG
jgi:type II secretory pathway predicted ATPase ExeA